MKKNIEFPYKAHYSVSHSPTFTEESLEKQKELITKLGKQVEVLTFSGGHELDVKMLARIIDSDS